MTQDDSIPSGRAPTDPDPETYAEIAAEIDQLMETVARLQELGGDADLPAIERNAKRVEGVAETLADNFPRELVEE